MSSGKTYSIDFGSGQNRVLDFSGYEIVETGGLPSQPRFELALIFKMHGNVKIKSNGEIVGESDSLIVINASCRLSLHTTIGRHILLSSSIDRMTEDCINRGPYFFSTFIHHNDAENLMHMIKGETVIIEWN